MNPMLDMGGVQPPLDPMTGQPIPLQADPFVTETLYRQLGISPTDAPGGAPPPIDPSIQAPAVPLQAGLPMPEDVLAAPPPAPPEPVGFGDAGQLAPPPMPFGGEPFAPPMAAPVMPAPMLDDGQGLAPPAPVADLTSAQAMDAAELERQRALTPADRMRDGVQREVDADRAVASQTDVAEAADDEARTRHATIWKSARADSQKKMADLRARAEQLSKENVDPDGWLKSRTGGQKAALYIAAAISGILNPRGKNSALELMEQHVNDYVQTQTQNLANKRAVLGMEQGFAHDDMAAAEEEFRESEAQRKAAWESTARKLASVRAGYDQRGTAAAKLLDLETAAIQNAAKADAEAEERTLRMDVQRHTMKHQDDTLAAQERARRDSAGQAAARLKLDKDKFKAEQDASKEPKPLSTTEQLAVDKLVVTDAITRKPLGNAKSEDLAKAANGAQQAALKVGRLARELANLRKDIGTTTDLPGVGSWFRGADNDANVALYKSKADELAKAIGKAEDPTSVLSQKEVEAIVKARIPEFNTPLSEGPEAADAKTKAIKDSVSAAVAGHMGAAGIDYKLGNYFEDEVTPEDTAAQSAGKAAQTYRPAEGPTTFKEAMTRGGQAEQPYLLNNVQVTAPIQALETVVVAGAKAGASPDAIADSKKAAQHLKQIAADPAHPGASLAQSTIQRMGLE